MAANRVECLVIGSGVIGLSIARSLARRGREVLLVDKADHVGAETSSRNSEVIHSGIYYPHTSLKARFCVEGKQMLYDYCQERNIPFRRCGKLVVATSDEQMQTLHQLYTQAQQNGVTDVQLLSRDHVLAMEPLVKSSGALYSPSTGVLDSQSLMLSLLADAESEGTTLALRSEVKDGRLEPDGTISMHVDGIWVTSTHVVNAGGLRADRIARMMHKGAPNPPRDQHSEWQPPRQYFCKGSYFQLQNVKEQPFQHLIYPIPDKRGGLGIHATIDVAGHVKFGPDVEWLDLETDPDRIDYTPDSARAEAFRASIKAYYPSLPNDALHVDYAGVRPKLSHPQLDSSTESLLFHDFRIATAKDHGVPGLVHLLGIESPGLTSSMALAEYVCDELLGTGGS